MQTTYLPATTETMNDTTYRGTVYSWNCDRNGHMNVQFYVAKFDEATWVLPSRLGLSAVPLSESKTATVAPEQHIRSCKEVFAGDSPYITSEITAVRETVILFQYRMFTGSDKMTAAQTRLTGLHIDAKLRKGVPLPAFVKEYRCRFSEPAYPG